MKARKRMTTSNKKFSVLDIVAATQLLSRSNSPFKRKTAPDAQKLGSMMQQSPKNQSPAKSRNHHSRSGSKSKQADTSFYKLDPNSVAYTNAVLESKINKH